MISAVGYRGAERTELVHDGLDEYLGDGGLVWVDLLDPTEDELRRIESEFGLHPLAIEDARKGGQRPKIERYPGHAFLVAYGSSSDPADLPELHVFVGAGWLVTQRFLNGAGAAVDVDEIRSRFERTRGDTSTVGFLLYTVLDVLVDGYFDLTDQLDEELEQLEDDLFMGLDPDDPRGDGADHTRSDMLQRQLLHLRRSLVVLRRRIVPLREVVLALLRRELEWIDDRTLLYLQDVLDHVLRVTDQIDGQRELVGNAVDAHLAIVSNRSNEIMKKMTSWGAILLGSTLIAGIYGMNFKHMPELGTRWGYPGALLSMAVLTAVLFVYFRRKRWI